MAIPEIDNLDGVPTIVATPIYFTYHAMLSVNSITDGNGNRFRASHILFTNSNDTRIYVQKVAPDGVTVLAHVQVALQIDGGIVKHDDFGLDYSGNDVIIANGGHALTPGRRKSPYCEARWVGVFENPGALTGTRGGASVSPEPAPEPGGEPVDYERIERIVEQEIAEFSQSFGDEGPRKAIFDKSADAMLYMEDPENYGAEWKTGHYQDVTFQRDMNRQYVALNKHIIGENPNLPVENQGFIDLMESIVERVVRRVLAEEEPS